MDVNDYIKHDEDIYKSLLQDIKDLDDIKNKLIKQCFENSIGNTNYIAMCQEIRNIISAKVSLAHTITNIWYDFGEE